MHFPAACAQASRQMVAERCTVWLCPALVSSGSTPTAASGPPAAALINGADRRPDARRGCGAGSTSAFAFSR